MSVISDWSKSEISQLKLWEVLTRLSSKVQTLRAQSFTTVDSSLGLGTSTSIPSHQHLRWIDFNRLFYTGIG